MAPCMPQFPHPQDGDDDPSLTSHVLDKKSLLIVVTVDRLNSLVVQSAQPVVPRAPTAAAWLEGALAGDPSLHPCADI